MHRDTTDPNPGVCRLGIAAALAWGIGQALAAAAEPPAPREKRTVAAARRASGADEVAALNAAELRKCMAKVAPGTRHQSTMMPLRDGVRLSSDNWPSHSATISFPPGRTRQRAVSDN